MDSSFIGEIRAFPYTFVPQGWVECNGQPLPVYQYQALYSIIGNRYGGNTTNFNVPNFQGAALVGVGSIPGGTVNYALGDNRYGTESVTLTTPNLPSHNHSFIGKAGTDTSRTAAAGTDNQSYLSNITYQRPGVDIKPQLATAYLNVSTNPVSLHANTITPSNGNYNGNLPHENRSPFLAIRYCICADGESYPVRP